MTADKHDIHERIYQFVLITLRFISKLPKTYINLQITGQLTRSVTSIGANDQEANGTFTRADFTHCYTIVRKEGKESMYWIRLLGDINEKYKKESEVLIKEVDEITRIVATIIFKTKNH